MQEERRLSESRRWAQFAISVAKTAIGLEGGIVIKLHKWSLLTASGHLCLIDRLDGSDTAADKEFGGRGFGVDTAFEPYIYVVLECGCDIYGRSCRKPLQ